MKLLNNFLKEMKIASRGFYFYVEIIAAVVLLVVLLVFVPESPGITAKEVVFLDMPTELRDLIINTAVFGEEEAKKEEFKLKPVELTYYDESSGVKITKSFDDKKTISVDVYEKYDENTGNISQIQYFTDDYNDMLRLCYEKKYYGARMYIGDDGLDYYETVIFGNETEKYLGLISAVHSNADPMSLMPLYEGQSINYLESHEPLNLRQSLIPLAVVVLNGFMGMFLIIAYISVDKSEGLIKAMAVTPTSTAGYFMSKFLVVSAIALGGSLLVSIPVMGAQPSYPLFILSVFSMAILSCALGLVTSSFFKDVKGAFGIMVILMLFLMLPTFTYFLPTFSPTWMKAMPSYYMLEAVRESILVSSDTVFILLSCGGMLAASAILFAFGCRRYRKSLGV